MSWLQYFLAKRRVLRERKLEQLTCPHQYEQVFQTNFNDRWGDLMYSTHDIYCPVCQETKTKLSKTQWGRIQNAQELRNKYTEGASSI